MLPHAQVAPQVYTPPPAVTVQRALVQPHGQPSDKVVVASVPSGGSQRAISTVESLTFVGPTVVGSRGPPVNHTSSQGHAAGNHVSLESQPVLGHAVAVGTVNQTRSVVTEGGSEKAILDTHTHTEITLNRGNVTHAALVETQVHSEYSTIH